MGLECFFPVFLRWNTIASIFEGILEYFSGFRLWKWKPAHFECLHLTGVYVPRGVLCFHGLRTGTKNQYPLSNISSSTRQI